MSRRSQEKRAARAKARAKLRARDRVDDRRDRSHPGATSDLFGWPEPPPPPRRPTTTDLLESARAGAPYGTWRSNVEEIGPAVFLADAESVLTSWVREAYGRGGWQPTEFIRHLSRRGKSAVAALARAVVAAERASRTGPTAKDPAWLRQWDASRLPKVSGSGWFQAWAATDVNWLKVVYRFSHFLGGMPSLDSLLPPPPGFKASRLLASQPSQTSANPSLERVRALLAKAESTEHESEAMAFTAKAQQLMTKYAIDQAMLAGEGAGPATPGVIRIPIDPPYLEAKALLLQVIAGHSRCRTALHGGVELSSVVGFSTDLEAVELLFTSLLVQAHHAMAEASAAAPPGGRTRSQSFRAAFLRGFTGRIDVRLSSVNQMAFDEAKAKSDAFLPVLRSRDDQINDLMDRHFPGLTGSRVRGGFDALGYHQGQLAGDAAALISGAIEAEA